MQYISRYNSIYWNSFTERIKYYWATFTEGIKYYWYIFVEGVDNPEIQLRK